MKFRAAADTAWTAAIVAAIAVVFRREISRVLARARADMEARRREVEADAERMRNGRGYLAEIRGKLVAEEMMIEYEDCGCGDGDR